MTLHNHNATSKRPALSPGAVGDIQIRVDSSYGHWETETRSRVYQGRDDVIKTSL